MMMHTSLLRRMTWLGIAAIPLLVFVQEFLGKDALFVVLGALTIASLLLARRNMPEFLLMLTILWFSAGYRAFNIGAGYRLHMLDILLLIMMFAYVAVRNETPVHPGIRRRRTLFAAVVLFIIPYGHVLAMANDVSASNSIMVFKNLAAVLPLVLFLPQVINRRQNLYAAFVMMIVSGLIIAIPAILEYHQGGYAAGSSYGDQFNRALFSAWGATMAVLVLTICAQAHWYLLGSTRSMAARVVIAVSALIHLYAIYISGTRNMWIAVLLTFSLSVYLRFGAWKTLILLPLFALVLSNAPDEGVRRMESFYFLKDTDQYGRSDTRWLDSSGADRAARMSNAWNMMKEEPFGRGWSASGWVHSDLLSIGVDVGVLPAALVLLLLIVNTVKAMLRARAADDDLQWLWISLSGMMITNILLFLFGGVTWIIQFALPSLFTLIMVDTLLHGGLERE